MTHGMLNRETGRRNCAFCEEKLEKGIWSLEYAGSAYKGRIHYKGVCIECVLELVYQMSGKKYLKRKVCEKIISRKVSKSI